MLLWISDRATAVVSAGMRCDGCFVGSVCDYSIPDDLHCSRQPGLYTKHLDSPEVLAFVIIVLQGTISVAVDMLPLPGGMGISELVIFK